MYLYPSGKAAISMTAVASRGTRTVALEGNRATTTRQGNIGHWASDLGDTARGDKRDEQWKVQRNRESKKKDRYGLLLSEGDVVNST